MKVIISGGGTGGHIFPAIAIADEIKVQFPNAEILFVGAKGRMEMEKIPVAGYPIKGLWISGLQRKLTIDNLSFPLKLISSLWDSYKIIRKFKPDIAIGVGGYASGALVYVATKLKIPTLIQEQNSFAGLTNRWLAKSVDRICVAYEGMEKFFPPQKIILTGNPIRKDIIEFAQQYQAQQKIERYEHFQLNPHKKTILIVGGSLGARSINEAISQDLHKFIAQDIQLLWQTGKNTFQKDTANEIHLTNPLIQQTTFIYQMAWAYDIADVVISRAGALAVSELCMVGKPTIFVPLPSAAEDHQTQNALALVEKNAAEMVKDIEAKNKLVDLAIQLLAHPEKRQMFHQNMLTLAKPSASKEIVAQVKKIVEKRKISV